MYAKALTGHDLSVADPLENLTELVDVGIGSTSAAVGGDNGRHGDLSAADRLEQYHEQGRQLPASTRCLHDASGRAPGVRFLRTINYDRGGVQLFGVDGDEPARPCPSRPAGAGRRRGAFRVAITDMERFFDLFEDRQLIARRCSQLSRIRGSIRRVKSRASTRASGKALQRLQDEAMERRRPDCEEDAGCARRWWRIMLRAEFETADSDDPLAGRAAFSR